MSTELPERLRTFLEQTEEGKQSFSDLVEKYNSTRILENRLQSHSDKKYIALGIGAISGAIIPLAYVPFLGESVRQFILQQIDAHKAQKAQAEIDVEIDDVLLQIPDELFDKIIDKLNI